MELMFQNQGQKPWETGTVPFQHALYRLPSSRKGRADAGESVPTKDLRTRVSICRHQATGAQTVPRTLVSDSQQLWEPRGPLLTSQSQA